MIWLIVIALVVIVCFGGVLLVGAPYLPTLNPQVNKAIELADLKAGDTMLELGCGDGKVIIAAAKQGINVIGYELNPILVLIAWLRTRRYRKQVKIIWGDFWTKPWPPAEAIFTFLLPRYMTKLNKKIIQYDSKPVKLVSFAFAIPDRKVDAEEQGIFVYQYK